jgi:hypothetical protein
MPEGWLHLDDYRWVVLAGLRDLSTTASEIPPIVKARRESCPFSCDIAYSESPAALRASAGSEKPFL